MADMMDTQKVLNLAETMAEYWAGLMAAQMAAYSVETTDTMMAV
jgi:hypothetical protein